MMDRGWRRQEEEEEEGRIGRWDCQEQMMLRSWQCLPWWLERSINTRE